MAQFRSLEMKSMWLAVLVLFVSACSVESVDEIEVRANFDLYRQSLIDRNGEVSRSYVSASTIEYYESLRALALYETEEALNQAVIIDRLTVYRIRAEWTGEQLETMTGAEVFIYAVDEGWVGSNLGALDIVSVRIFGDSATTNLSVNGERMPWGFTFHKEEGAWRLDLASMMTLMNGAMIQQIDQIEMTEMEFIDFFLRSSGYSNGADGRILNPLVSTEPN
ncbi:MAG: hypothetical protein P8P99_04505 [Maricaulis sp.]|nr:hypothetical protein [Maricaulis sp.]